jgi:F-type H+-transporting ATPase subunit b
MLGSIPTICFFLILLAAYAVLVRKPLEKVLADRHARTGGAMDGAHQAIAAAEAKTAEYEKRMRDARGAIFESQVASIKRATESRDKAIAAARSQAQTRIDAARAQVVQAGDEAKSQIEAGSDALSQQIIAAILPHRGERVQA